jgi:hypothetical protein
MMADEQNDDGSGWGSDEDSDEASGSTAKCGVEHKVQGSICGYCELKDGHKSSSHRCDTCHGHF